MSLISVSLSDKYDLTKNRVFLTGTQALVRLCLMQAERDRKAGLNTAGYVTGYRGSPVGGLDAQFGAAKETLAQSDIIFEPGLNEDLAATALWGTQQAELRGEGTHDGVFGLWYGKGPGVDRSGDVLRHANVAGSSKNGGVLVLMGDDHTCESSTTVHQSEYALVDAMIPVMNPANVAEIMEYGLHGWQLSRYAGTWCGLKAVKDNVESTASVDALPNRYSYVLPDHDARPEGGLNIRLGDMRHKGEEMLHRDKLAAVQAYVAANGLNKTVLSGGKAPKIGIVSTGKSYMDTVQALDELGIDEVRAAQLGLSLFKVAMPWPLEPTGIADFAKGLDLLIVVEEKRGLIEDQIKTQLYGQKKSPQIIGKADEAGKTLFQSWAALNPIQIAAAIGTRLANLTKDTALTATAHKISSRLSTETDVLGTLRLPYFCAGCPHNSSTKLPDGSRGYAGIGCHWMAQFMDREVDGYTHMGGEGANWIGESKFSTRKHMFQNIGDGTYNHSGLMAIRAASASGTNITFKVLYNDAVAMTGGQAHEGGLTPYDIAADMVALGAAKIEMVTEDPTRIDRRKLPSSIAIHPRSDLMKVQQELSQMDGLTVLIYDQTCATEKRRRRKRGTMADAPKRVFINPAVCEGCGDCGMQSNCVAILPLDTDLGRKRQIDQSACNKDYSCVNGFCPSFVSLEGAVPTVAQAQTITLPPLPEPNKVALNSVYSIALTGVGGTGVVTIGALLGMAAHLEGKGCGIIDMAGLAQKGGAVVSHIKLAPAPEDISAIRISRGQVDLVLGCDFVVVAGDQIIPLLDKQTSQIVVNSHEMMTGAFTQDPDFKLPVNMLGERLRGAVANGASHFVNATEIATRLLGDSIGANMFMLGVAFQNGLIPLSAKAIEQAVSLNGVAIDLNLQAFAMGRAWVVEASSVENTKPDVTVQSVEDLIADHSARLIAYQNTAYAQTYRDLVAKIQAVDPAEDLTRAVATYAYKLMAYKDEYEVARLYSDGSFKSALSQQFAGQRRMTLHLAPPLLSRKDPVSGRPRKREFGPWIFTALGLLSRFKGLRGTALDVFGYSRERRAERALVADYHALITQFTTTDLNYPVAVALASLPEKIRGFGPVKEANMAKVAVERTTLLAQLQAQGPTTVAAE